jgi:ketosteroid isomerase-like protein
MADTGCTSSEEIVALVTAFNQALNARDLDAMMGWMTPDCVFENTAPPPDGARYEGQAAVRAFWQDFFAGSTRAWIAPEEIFAVATPPQGGGGRCVMRWIYRWIDPQGRQGHIRGVDVYTIRDGKIAEKLSYVKG